MDINVLKVAIEAQLKPSLTFYSKQGDIGNRIWEQTYPDWETDGKRVIFKNLDHKEISLIEFRRVLTIKEDIGNYASKNVPINNFISVLKAYLATLPSSKTLRLGLRITGYQDRGLKFVEIAKIMQPKIYPDSKSPLFKITAAEFQDVGFAAVYQKQGYKIRLQVGPVTRDELLARTQPAFPVSEAQIPESSIFFDIDFFKEEPNKGFEEKFCNDALKIIEEDLTNFLNYIFK